VFAEIGWTGSPSSATFAADIVAVLTGETDENNLSTDVVPGASSIIATIPAGWTIYDSATGVADEYILRAPTVDDATQYKYTRIKVTGTTTRTITCSTMEDWNPTTNVATNETTAGSMSLLRTPIGSFGDTVQIVTLIATARYIAIRATGYLYTTIFPCVEISRIHPSLAIGTGRVPAVTMDDATLTNDNLVTYNTYIPRILDENGTADITNGAIRALATHQRPSCVDTATEFDSLSTDVGYDSGGTPYYGIHLILFERRDLVGGIIGTSEVSKLWYVQAEVVAGFEDKTTHELDAPNDLKCLWTKTNLVTDGTYPRIFIEHEV